MAYQYEMLELQFRGEPPRGSEADIDLKAVFRKGSREWHVRGFYAGGGGYRIRFLPEETGAYQYKVSGIISGRGELEVLPAREGRRGPVRARGIHLYYADGTPWTGLGTTVYALAHQEEELIDQTMGTLGQSPFTKVRMCLFPKYYTYNHNDPPRYAFRRNAEGVWDPDRPDFDFWDAFEKQLRQLDDMGIQADLILFHPYDRWGFATMSMAQNRTYLDYLLRRFAAFPNVWWSLANEYDLCEGKSMDDWAEIEEYVAARDPFHHMLGNHNCFVPYDAGRKHITHMSWQTRQLSRIPEMLARYGKPVTIDECCYEGSLPDTWGSISGKEMTARFWRTAVAGGYCTHGETFLPDEKEIVWWAKGGTLRGESPARIAFLRTVLESLPGPLYPVPAGLSVLAEQREKWERSDRTGNAPGGFFGAAMDRMDPEEKARFMACENIICGACGNREAPDALLWYLDLNCCSRFTAELPAGTWRITVLDTWNMTRTVAAEGVSGRQEIALPGHEWIAVLAEREEKPVKGQFYGQEGADVRPAAPEYAAVRDPRMLYDLLGKVWCAETCAPRMRAEWSPENPTWGQCSITAFLAQDIFGGQVFGVPLEDGNVHCFNKVGDCVFDLTSEQFGDVRLDYGNCTEQFREIHFAKAEKKQRYEYLKALLDAKLFA